MGKKHGKEWWHTDEEGRRIGYLWPEEFSAILESWYGERLWVNAVCEEFDLSRSQVDRYRHGQAPIPKIIAMVVQMIADCDLRGAPMPVVSAHWLPDQEEEEET